LEIDPEQAGRALHFQDHGYEFRAAYARSTVELKVKIWGGHDVDLDEEEVSSPPYTDITESQKQRIFGGGTVLVYAR
jgi:hypothetical protein